MQWSFEPGVIAPLAATAILYARARASLRERLLFWSGSACLLIALVSPVDKLGERLFSMHMLQHEILMLAAAPLIVLSHPGVSMLFAFPLRVRKLLGRFAKWRLWRTVSHPVSAWSIHAAAIWIWHAPPLFDAALASDWVHAAQHLSFFGSALLFWWSLFELENKGAAILSLFSTAVHTTILGALLTFSRSIWYHPYEATVRAWGWSPIEDQQAGGLIMWVPAALVYLAAGLWMLSFWLRESDGREAVCESR